MFVRVVFVRSAGTPDGWERGDLWDTAAAIQEVELECDVGVARARQYGAATSGHAVLISPEGQIVFRGGLTRARGREGAAPGGRAVLDWVSGRPAASDAPVFGCPRFNTDD
jgi:hypothetical protein